jgi:hypothetical protein
MLFTPQRNFKNIKNSVDRHLLSSEESDTWSEESDEDNNIKINGVLLIQSVDPVGKLISSITRQEYSMLGIY